jgi:hypothetical protein
LGFVVGNQQTLHEFTDTQHVVLLTNQRLESGTAQRDPVPATCVAQHVIELSLIYVAIAVDIEERVRIFWPRELLVEFALHMTKRANAVRGRPKGCW